MITAQYLIRMGCNIHDKDLELRTPLHRAVQNSGVAHFDIACLLLRLGAEVEIQQGNDENDMMCLAKASRGRVSACACINT